MAIKFTCGFKEDDDICGGEIVAAELQVPLVGSHTFQARCGKCYNEVTFVGPDAPLGFLDKRKGSKKFKQSGVLYATPIRYHWTSDPDFQSVCQTG